jgi:hypothetical protein
VLSEVGPYVALAENGTVVLPVGSTITIPEGPRLIVSLLVVRAGPPIVRRVEAMSTPVGRAVTVWEPSVNTAAGIIVAGVELGRRRVEVPIIRAVGLTVMGVPLMVRAGSPGVRACPPMTTSPDGSRTTGVDPTLVTVTPVGFGFGWAPLVGTRKMEPGLPFAGAIMMAPGSMEMGVLLMTVTAPRSTVVAPITTLPE